MIDKVRNISIEDYDYPLPDERIAKYPLSERDASKLLVLNKDNISSSHFKDIGDFLPKDSLLIFNETKVVRARLQFTKDSGAAIEIFCLEPITGNGDYQLAFSSKSPSRWKCLVGNSRRWKNETALSLRVPVSPCPRVSVRVNVRVNSLCEAFGEERQLLSGRVFVGTRRVKFRRGVGSSWRDTSSSLSPP